MQLKASIALLVLAAFSLPEQALACSCMWSGPFLDVAKTSDVVLFGVVRSHDANSLELEVVETWRGSETRAVVRVWGDNGMLCRPYVSKFPVGTKWLMALTPESSGVGEGRRATRGHDASGDEKVDYVVSVCGEYTLQIVEGAATGIITGSNYDSPRETLSMKELRRIVSEAP